jgi:hypothetical protein
LKNVSIGRVPAITTDPEKLAEIFKNLKFRCPSWNPEPLDHLEGRPVKEDPYPVFNGIPMLKRFPKVLNFDTELLLTRHELIDNIEMKCGVKAACQIRVIIDKLIAKEYVLPSSGSSF